jgi:hypothetical protein
MLFAADVHVESLQRFCTKGILLQGDCDVLQSAMLIYVDKMDMTMEMGVPIVLVLDCSSKCIGATTEPPAREHAASKHILTRIAVEGIIFSI